MSAYPLTHLMLKYSPKGSSSFWHSGLVLPLDLESKYRLYFLINFSALMQWLGNQSVRRSPYILHNQWAV